MVKKKSNVAWRRKKSNTRTTLDDRSKQTKTTDERFSAEYSREGILHAIKLLLAKMDDKDLLAAMVYLGGSSMEDKEKSKTLFTTLPIGRLVFQMT